MSGKIIRWDEKEKHDDLAEEDKELFAKMRNPKMHKHLGGHNLKMLKV